MGHDDIGKLESWIRKGLRHLEITGLSGTARAYLISCLLSSLDTPSLLVLPDWKAAERLYRQLAFFLPHAQADREASGRRLFDFPIYDISPLSGLSPHKEVVTRRIQALYALTSEPMPIVVTSIEALLLRILPKETLINALEYLEEGEEIDRDALIRALVRNSYCQTSLVEERGDFAVRGGVVDFFSPLYAQPLRLEFWGDRLESIRLFDPVSQRSTSRLEELILLPAGEIILGPDNIRRARSMGRLPGKIDGSVGFPGQEAWLNHFYARPDSLFDYMPGNTRLFLIEPHRLDTASINFINKFHRDAERFRKDAEERDQPFPEIEGIILSHETGRRSMDDYPCIELSELAMETETRAERTLHIREHLQLDLDVELRLEGKGRVSMAPLAENIARWLESGSRVVLVCRTEQQAHRLKEILQNYRVRVDEVVNHWTEISPGKGLSFCLGRLSKGFTWPTLGLHVISEDEIFGPKRSRSKAPGRRKEGGLTWTAFSQLDAGNLVVHQDHGIGRYAGLKKMEVEDKINDFVIIEYEGSDRLYIPADRVSFLQKYIGADEREPKLDRLGGRSWDIVKKRAKKSVREIAKQLVQIYALRRYRKGISFSPPDNLFREFEATFQHEETPDQVKAIEDVLSDMESEQPMDRLICGDVGFGKTEVAIRASFKAVMDGKQVAVLVPTTVLAEQHEETFRSRMAPYQVKVAVLSRFKSNREQRDLLAAVRSGQIDIIIGTHRLLQKDVSFSNLGLLIIDEEQRFGVNQKEKLKKYRALVDVLALTATPIPRTLHMSLMGVRDLSIIETPPVDRLAIQTYLCPSDEPTVSRAIEHELNRNGQIFFVHNRVQSIETVADRMRQLVPQARIEVAHGQMKEKDLEKTMLQFLKKEIDVLVCTTIIESGLDIPSVNTIIVNQADRFGLAQIYQLRGRVGRSKENAYAYLLLSPNTTLSREAEKRLKALMDFSQLGAGIHLAMHDLKIRGGGNILGFSQSGHISAIGYELYLKLIEQAIAELKGEEWQEEINPEINADIPAYLPTDYISDPDIRLNLYRRLSGLREDAELKRLIEEMKDRFGEPPREVINLLDLMSVRLMLKQVRATRLDVKQGLLSFSFSEDTPLNPAHLIDLVGEKPQTYRFSSDTKFQVRIGLKTPMESLLEAGRVINRMQQFI